MVSDILDKWDVLSQNNKFHAILATNSIAEAIDYYRRLKAAKPELKSQPCLTQILITTVVVTEVQPLKAMGWMKLWVTTISAMVTILIFSATRL